METEVFTDLRKQKTSGIGIAKTEFGNGELDDGKQIEHFRKRSFIKFYQPRSGCVDTGKNLFVL